MITKEQFTKVIEDTLKLNKEYDRWDDFGINLWELPIGDIVVDLAESIWDITFDEDGVDWINWWIYERPALFEGDEVNKAYNEDGSEIPTETVDDLWNIVKKFRK
jgi:hypothetical protein